MLRIGGLGRLARLAVSDPRDWAVGGHWHEPNGNGGQVAVGGQAEHEES